MRKICLALSARHGVLLVIAMLVFGNVVNEYECGDSEIQWLL